MRLLRLVVYLAILFVSLTSGRAQEGSTSAPRALVTLEVTSETLPRTLVSVISGERASVALPDGQGRLELIPAVGTDETVAFRLFQVSPKLAADVPAREFTEFQLRPGQSYIAEVRPRITFTLKGVRSVPASSGAPQTGPKPKSAILTLGLLRPELGTATARVHVGELLRVESADSSLALRPRLLRDDRVEFHVFRLAQGEDIGDRAEPFSRFILKKGAEYVSSGHPKFTLTLRDIKLTP